MQTLIPLIELTVVGVPLLFLLTRRIAAGDRHRIRRVLLIAFALRLVVATVFDVFPAARVFHEDASGYETSGQLVASSWLGEGPPMPLSEMMSGPQNTRPGFLLVCGALYYLFGRFRLVVTAVTALCGAISVFYVYLLSARFFHHRVAMRAAKLTVYFPSMIIWSAMALKDPVMIMLIMIGFDAMLSLREKVNPIAIVRLVLVVGGMWLIRFYIVYFLLLATVVSLVLARGRSLLATLPRQIALLAVLLVGFAGLGVLGGLQQNTEYADLSTISTYRHGMATTAHSGFYADADVSTPTGAITFLPIGAAVLLLGPFPWQMTSLRPLMVLPEMLVWWSMLPALWRGLKFAAKRDLRNLLPIMVFGGTLVTLYALTLGNVGAAFRQRAQVFVFFFIFCAVGHYVRVCERRGIDLDSLRVGGTSR